MRLVNVGLSAVSESFGSLTSAQSVAITTLDEEKMFDESHIGLLPEPHYVESGKFHPYAALKMMSKRLPSSVPVHAK